MMRPDNILPAHAVWAKTMPDRTLPHTPAYGHPPLAVQLSFDAGEFAGGGPALPSGLEYSKLDGTTHVNIYSRGETALGRGLSHFYYSPFVHPYYGPFNCMEGFWYYIKASEGHRDDALRTLVGHKAKEYGKRLPARRRDNFKQVIVEANFHKVEQNSTLKQQMIDSVLPFDHYYLFERPGVHENGGVFIRPQGFGWLVEGFEAIRQELKRAAHEQRVAHWPQAEYD